MIIKLLKYILELTPKTPYNATSLLGGLNNRNE